MRAPMLSGSMTVEDGRIRHFSLPHALERINGVMTFDSRGVNLDELTARIGDGPVTFGGSIGIDGYVPGRVDLTMTGEDMGLRYPQGAPWLRARVDAELALRGTVEALTLEGDVTVREALYTQDFSAGGSLFDFGQSAAAPASSFVAPTLPLTYDIRIRAPSTILVRNNLLKEMAVRADLRLQGTYDRPALLGNIDVDRGYVEFEAKRFQVRRGSITFNNPTKIEPFFDVEADTRIRVPGETYRITVRTAGLDPVQAITFSSDPYLPEYQLLALLISDVPPGRDVEQRQYSGVTPTEQIVADRLTRALTGQVSSEIGRAFREAFGIQTFQLTTQLLDPNVAARLEPAARVTIGTRISNNIFLTYSRSLSSVTRDQVFLLEIDQTDQLSWILSRNEDGTYALDLRVRRSF
jgi:autotransporter translocation and assembly factor TamB